MPDDSNKSVLLFSEREKRALKPPDNLPADVWAEKKRVLPAKNPLGRRWLNSNSPGLQITMHLAIDPVIAELYDMKGAQLGVSECFRCVMGCQAEQDPLPALLILPNEKDGKKVWRKEYQPLFRDSDGLKDLVTGRKADFTKAAIRLLNAFELDLGWSGSASSLASDPKARVFLDETDKYDEQGTKEAPPIELARVRTRKFVGRSKVYAYSTPTIESGQINQLMQEADILLRFFVPCPHCGHFQVLHQDNLKWEKFPKLEQNKEAAIVKSQGLAWFECVHPDCRKPIKEEHKRQIVPQMYAANEEQTWKIYPDNRRDGLMPPGDKVGIHYPAFYDYQVPWAEIAARWIIAGHDPRKLMALWNDTFGEPFKQRSNYVPISQYSKMCVPDPEKGFEPAKAGLVPLWASRVIITTDTQKDHFYWVARAWGYGGRSQRIGHGIARTFEELEQIEARGWRYPDDKYSPLVCHTHGIDTGGTKDDEHADSRTYQVYEWCRKRPTVRIPLKGASKPIPQGVRWRDISYKPAGAQNNPRQVRLHLFDTEMFADLMMTAVESDVPTGESNPDGTLVLGRQWLLNDHNDPTYNLQMSNVEKAWTKWRGKQMERHMPKTAGSRHDYWDCEKMQFVVAIGMNRCTGLATEIQMSRAIVTQPIVKPPTGIGLPSGRGWGQR